MCKSGWRVERKFNCTCGCEAGLCDVFEAFLHMDEVMRKREQN